MESSDLVKAIKNKKFDFEWAKNQQSCVARTKEWWEGLPFTRQRTLMLKQEEGKIEKSDLDVT